MAEPASVDNTKKEETGSASSAPDGNILQHIKQLEQSKAQLEQSKQQLEQKLKEADARADRMSMHTLDVSAMWAWCMYTCIHAHMHAHL